MKQNEIAYKKLAEVAAIIHVLTVLNKKSSGILLQDILQRTTIAPLLAFDATALVPPNFRDVFDAKYNRTVSKIQSMMELYIGDKWNDQIEVTEWCGFHLGAGLVHAALVERLLSESREQLHPLTEAFSQSLVHIRKYI